MAVFIGNEERNHHGYKHIITLRRIDEWRAISTKFSVSTHPPQHDYRLGDDTLECLGDAVGFIIGKASDVFVLLVFLVELNAVPRG